MSDPLQVPPLPQPTDVGPQAKAEAPGGGMVGGMGSSLGSAAVQRKLARRLVQRKQSGLTDGPGVHAAAAEGLQGSAQALPHLDRIQASFGGHDVSGIQAHVGGPAAAASEKIGAGAYATGSAVAFAGSPDLHTAAHEAAHVVQQRGGVQLKGGVGEVGDPYERHADAVADRVVAGQSAAELLSAAPSASGGPGLQRKPDGTAAGGATTPSTTTPAVDGATAGADAATKTDAAIEALDLNAAAKAGAYELKKAHPTVAFTSGRRDLAEQASAMAGNVLSNRKWIEQTYASNEASQACQKWVDDNPTAKTKAAIAAGLLTTLTGLGDKASQISKHLTGSAFDVQPVSKDADKIKATIRGLTGLVKFLEVEGGLTRWHAQF